MGKARVPLTTDQAEALLDLYLKVPKAVQIHHEWNSPEGMQLLEMIYGLVVEENVPLRWIAVKLNIDEGMLQQTVNRRNHLFEKRRGREDQ